MTEKGKAIMDNIQKSLNGKICLVTGASRGLGRAIAVEYAKQGANLVINSRSSSQSDLEKTELSLREIGVDVISVLADVSIRADVERLAAQALSQFQKVDVLVNNASALGPTPMPYLMDYPLEDFQKVINTNLIGPFQLTRTLIGQMLSHHSGSIINISSDAGVTGYPTWGAYGVSKAALDHMTRTWAAELTDSGVRINSVDPGDMNTAMKRASEPGGNPSQWALPESVTSVFVYLASDEASAVNGERLSAKEFPSNPSR
jgi:NAD(P)-dependent dehydrogenase (short-subunit alcohol dehydrogenase family)